MNPKLDTGKEEVRSAPHVTMREVGARAGVSATVVSMVLNNRVSGVRVSEATAERVRQAAQDLGYRMNVMGRSFRSRQTMMIGVLHGVGFGRHRLHGNAQYFAALLDGIIDGAFDHGYSVTLCPKLFGQSPEDAMSDGRFDGLVWYSAVTTEKNRRMLAGCSVPMVLIHTPWEEFSGRFPTVIGDNDQGIGLAVDHLVALGHRKIGFALDGIDLFAEAVTRRRRFFDHLSDHGLPSSSEACFDVRRDDLSSFLSVSDPITALVAANDGVAADLYAQAKRSGIRIPDQLSVVGFDSTNYCLQLNPPLTSVSQPLESMGRSAVDLLVQSIRGEAPDPPFVILPCGLDVRDSTTSADNR
jgi:LacI family transcriptional regulator, galactose operon repressor